MDYIKLHSIPKIAFAHTFSHENYHNILGRRKSSIEVTYLSEGTLNLLQGDVQFIAHTGDFICNLYQKDMEISTEDFHSHRTVISEVDFDISTEPSPEAIPLLTIIHFQESLKYKKYIDEIIRTTAISPERNLECAGLFLQLLDIISAESFKSAQDNPDSYNPYVKKAKRYIYENLSRMIRQEEIADFLKITPEYLCSVFKKETGETIMHYINSMKLNSIYSLIERENISLSRAAEIYGYSDPSYVSRLYKKYFGASISQNLEHSKVKKQL